MVHIDSEDLVEIWRGTLLSRNMQAIPEAKPKAVVLPGFRELFGGLWPICGTVSHTAVPHCLDFSDLMPYVQRCNRNHQQTQRERAPDVTVNDLP